MPFTSYSTGLPPFEQISITVSTREMFHIKTSNKIKYLGIFLDSHLRWDHQVNYLIKKLRFVLYKLKYLSNILKLTYLKILYYALVESHLTYGLIAWGSAGETLIKYLQKVQKSILKVLFHKPRTYPTTQLYQETGVLNICQLYVKVILLKQYKDKATLKAIQHSYPTRYKESAAEIPLMKKAIGKKSFTYLAPKLYNQLPSDLKKINSSSLFKKKK